MNATPDAFASNAKHSRNKRYEAKQRAEGLVKVTLWVPEREQDNFQLMAQACRQNRDLEPFTLRSKSTGKIARSV